MTAAPSSTACLRIPESLTPLRFTPLYDDLAEEDRTAYNRLHGLYFLEQIIFFEQIMGRPALDWIARNAPTEELRREAREFAAEEDRHSSWFRGLLREADPERYARTDRSLIAAPPGTSGLLRFASRRVRFLPGLLWLQLMAEERAVYFGREFLAAADRIEPSILEVQRRHLADEPGHIRRDEMFLRWLWPATPEWLRRWNARWVRWMVYEFFHLPRRSGWRVVERWLGERPHLAPRREEFRDAMLALGRNGAYLRTLYPRRHLPRTAALAAPWPELSFLDQLFTD